MVSFVKIPQEDVDSVLKLFYRTKLRRGEMIIDNRDSVIAKETGLPQHTVQSIIASDLDIKIDKVNNNCNTKKDE